MSCVLMSDIKNLKNRLKGTPRMRIVFVSVVAALLLLVTTGMQFSSATTKSQIHATGDLSYAAVTPDIAPPQFQGSLQFRTLHITDIWTGALNGKSTSTFLGVTRDITALTNPGMASALGTFRGTVGDSDSGVFAYVMSYTSDRSDCGSGCPPGAIKYDGTLTVVEGSGIDGLAGICGGGTWKASSSTLTGTYDFTFHFGKDCKANDQVENGS